MPRFRPIPKASSTYLALGISPLLPAPNIAIKPSHISDALSSSRHPNSTGACIQPDACSYEEDFVGQVCSYETDDWGARSGVRVKGA
ncbi:hypothetical protein PM082_004584 [Marasmius tenuissimus]|nr:hypothetical protein PM082_004584 [Marasmius tenuissimus]